MTLSFWLAEGDESFEDEREVIYPGKQPVNGEPHVLVVEEDPEDGFGIEHTHGCLDQWGEADCDVAWNQDWVGLDEFFHRALVEGDDRTDGLIPGRYWVEAWSSEYYSYAYGTTEYDHGIALLYPEEAE
ncbi:hypothetical protein ACFXOY_17880 [Streptomyces niveus]|uniref:hypothetical protein n=1 Tax=Streptomyces niveus TaxID=193462 RepID=UPI00368337C4